MLSNLLQLLELIKWIVHQKCLILSPYNDYLNFGNRVLMEEQKPMMFH